MRSLNTWNNIARRNPNPAAVYPIADLTLIRYPCGSARRLAMQWYLLLISLISVPVFASHMDAVCSDAEGEFTGDGSNWMLRGKKPTDIKIEVENKSPLDLGRDEV